MSAALVHGIGRSLRKNADEAWAFLSGQMPTFVTHRNPPVPGTPPVFVFHDVEPDAFAGQLEHLTRNGYRTLDAEGLADALQSGDAREGEVALTFDDATWSFWAYAYPLLRRSGFRAVLFVVPAVVPDSADTRPNLEDEWEGRSSREETLAAARRHPFCTWSEIERMHASGVVDVQSHSLSHSRIPVSPRVVDFLGPGFDSYAGGFDIPLSTLDDGRDGAGALRPGAPVFESAPRLSGRLRFREDPGLVRELIAVARRQPETFFDDPGWREELRRIVERRPPRTRGGYESDREREAAIRHEMSESRRRIEDRLPAHAVRHLGYPWHAGSDLADRLAAECGYRSVHYGACLRDPDAWSGPPLRVRRIPERYLLRLPGSGRASLRSALASGRRRPSPTRGP